MKKTTLLITCLSFLIGQSLNGELYQTDSYLDLAAYASPNSLVITDINGVLIDTFEQGEGQCPRIALVEPQIPEVISRLQQENIPFLGLTCQPVKRAKAQHAELKGLNIDLSMSAILEKTPSDHYRYGILFCGATGDKGKELKEFLGNIDFQPECVVLIDDTLKNLIIVELAMDELGIPFIGLHYCPKK